MTGEVMEELVTLRQAEHKDLRAVRLPSPSATCVTSVAFESRLRSTSQPYNQSQAPCLSVPQKVTVSSTAAGRKSSSRSHKSTSEKQSRKRAGRLGPYAIGILVIGTVATLIALAFITYLWKGVGATESWNHNKFASGWRNIILSGWLPRLVTLSSLVIRLAIALKASVGASMLAVLALESFEVPLRSTAQVSLIRNSNSGPHDLLWQLLKGLPRLLGTRTLALVFILTLTTALSQFTSTILLSDLKEATIVGDTIRKAIPFGQLADPTTLTEYEGIDYWLTKTPFYPAFAEYTDGNDEPGNDSYWLVDTGQIRRTLPPFPAVADRETLRNYTGMATVIEMRVRCMRPYVENITFSQESYPHYPYIAGRLYASPPSIVLDDEVLSYVASFNCSVVLPLGPTEANASRPYIYPRESKEWATSVCRIPDPYNPPYDGSFLLLNTTKGVVTDYQEDWSRREYSGTWEPSVGPWIAITPKDPRLRLSATLCFMASQTNDTYVNFYSDTVRTEPTLGWDLTKGNYITEGIRRQLGALGGGFQTPSERGIFRFNPDFSFNKTGSANTYVYERAAVESTLGLWKSLCTYCESLPTGYDFTHRSHVALFQDILTTTKNPALALSALCTTLMSMAYYDFLPELRVTTDAQSSHFISIVMPRRWTGYAIVASMVAAHFILLGLVLIWFLARAEFSTLGSAWQAIFQVTVGETAHIVAHSNTRSDAEVWELAKKDLGKREDAKRFVGVAKVPGSESVGIVERRRKGL